MVLRSERELLGQNKDLETEITELKLMVEEKNREVGFVFKAKRRDEVVEE